MKKAMPRHNGGFTLIELLVVISIIGILIGISLFGLQGARESSRDARRKSDLEMIRSGLEIYKSDCNTYPATLGTSLTGACPGPTINTYISLVPTDPLPGRLYPYSYSVATKTYILCTSLENPPSPAVDVTGCGSCGLTCNYKVTSP